MIQYCNYDIKGTLATTGTITSGGVITAPGGNSSQWNVGYANSITGLSVSGTTTKTLTATQQDGGTITASWADDSGSNNYLTSLSFNTGNGILTAARQGLSSVTVDLDGRYVTSSGVTSVNFKTDGTALNVASNTITGSGTMTGIWQGTASEYVNGLGDRVTFPSIPQGDITSVNAGTNLNGGGTSGAVTLNLDAAIELTSVQYGSGVTLSESSDRADLLYINSSTSTWGGLQIGNTSNEFIFSLMGDGNVGGIYDDQNADWLIQWTENSAVRLYFNAGQKLTTTNTGVTITGTASATTFNGALSGNATTATNASNASRLTHNANRTDSASYPVIWMETGSTSPAYSCAAVTITSSAGRVNATTFNGALTGNATTSTTLQTARTIAGVSFNGSTNISLNNNAITNGAGYITSSSLPSVGNGTFTVTGNTGLSGSGSMTANQSGNSSATLTNTDRGSSQAIYKNFTASSGGTATANSNNDTLTIAAGTNVTTVRSGDTITINATNDGQGVTSIATTNGITGGTITSTGTLQVDSTVVRTTGNQTVGGSKNFSSTIVGHSVNLTSGNGITTQRGSGTVAYPYAISSSQTGLFAASDNANSIFTVNRHPGNYYSQLGFSSNGNLYYRNFVNTAINTTQGWNQLAFTSSIPTVNNGVLTMTTGTGLDGGTTFAANQSGNTSFNVTLDLTEISLGAGLDSTATGLTLDLSEFTDMTAGMNTNDEFIVLDSSAERRKRAGEIGLSIFSNDAGFITSSSIPSVGNGTLTVQGTGVLGGSGTFTANQSGNSTISVTHDNSGVSAGSYARATVTVNATGHVTSISANSDANTNYYTTTATFNTGNGIISFSGAGGQPAYSVDIDGRFLPLGGGTMSGKIGRSSAIVGFLEGSYNNVGDNATNTNPIYTIGSSYNPASTTLGNMYGMGFSHSSASFISLTGASGWGTYIAADGDARIFLSGSTGSISASGTIYVSGGNSGQWNTHTSNTGTISSINATSNGGALGTSNTLTGNGTLTLAWQGNTASYVRGDGSLATFPSIPQGDITNVSTTSPITGGGSSGSVNISHASSGVSAATYTAATVTVNATGHVTSASSNTIPSVGNGQIDGRTSGNGLSGSMDATANQSGNTTFTVTSNATTAATANTIAYRDGSADLNVRLLRANYANQSNISGAIAFRVNNSSDNYLRYCSSPSAIRTFIGAASSSVVSGVTSVATGGGLTGGTITSTGTLSHADTSSQGSVNNSGNTYIQDVTLDTYGHVTGISSATTTLLTLGYTGATNANYITNNNQLTNGAGYVTSSGGSMSSWKLTADAGGIATIDNAETVDIQGGTLISTARASNTIIINNDLTNNNQLTNGAGYTNNVGDITAVTAGTGMTGGGTSGSVTLNVIGGTGITANANDVAIDYAGSNSFVMAAPNGSVPDGDDYMIYGSDSSDDGSSLKAQFVDIPLSIFDNDAGFSGSGVTSIATTTPILGGTITSSGTISLKTPQSGQWHNGGAIVVGSDGLSEIGRYLDFHTTNTSTADYNVRLQADTNGKLHSSATIRSEGNLEAVGNMVAGYLRTTNGSSYQPSHSFTSDTNTGMYRPGTDQIGFSAGGANRMNVSTSAVTTTVNLGVGTASPSTRLHVDGVGLIRDSNGVGDFYLGNYATANHFRFHTNNSNTYFDMNCGNIYWRDGGSSRYTFFPSTANMTVNGTITQNSDIRIKENVVEIGDCISKVQAMRGVYYNRTDFNTEVTKVGVIAQEVEAVLPELILESPDDGFKSVAYSELTAVLINAIKEQQEIIEDLKTRIIKLEK